MNGIKMLILSLMVLLFLFGLFVFSFPYINEIHSNLVLAEQTHLFSMKVEENRGNPSHDETSTDSSDVDDCEYPDLWKASTAYNLDLYDSKQADLFSLMDYQTPSLLLADYGLDNEVFAILSIPKLELEMPVYIGASDAHLNNGAAVVSMTSLPIGGKNTNCVIAGHRGWYGADYFYRLDQLQLGDIVKITNLWEQLTYKVTEIRIIAPNDIDAILIQEGKDLITLLTCHPPASGGKQRYLVYCERYS